MRMAALLAVLWMLRFQLCTCALQAQPDRVACDLHLQQVMKHGGFSASWQQSSPKLLQRLLKHTAIASGV